ncbi:uncharacterized protein FIBRA_07738 [Fibroporia radiculosa]|uniref:Uncharacterized protein n=1 Tax=Fibroporia radiculosa TaxID=599839 RepID=J4GFE9_9APHY|nr:uncharacterized protein FIBRA_07738 [Fibroporia radiculosa]CCM05513.1 predicted protein [Fibroporia radiculosa]
MNRIKDVPGYKNPVFKGKEERRAKVQANVAAKGFIPRELVPNKVSWFYSHLGIDDTYLQAESIDVISDHIIALFGAKVLAYTKMILLHSQLIWRRSTRTVRRSSNPGRLRRKGLVRRENRIDGLFLDKSTPDNIFHLETYRSQGSISVTASQQLRCYFVTGCNFPPASASSDRRTDIRTVSDPVLEKASENTLEIYPRVMWNVESWYGPVIEVFEVEGSRERRLVIGYKMGGTSKFFSALSNLYHFCSLYSAQ